MVFDFVRRQNGATNGLMVEDMLLGIFKVEMEQRESLLHLQLAKAGLRRTDN